MSSMPTFGGAPDDPLKRKLGQGLGQGPNRMPPTPGPGPSRMPPTPMPGQVRRPPTPLPPTPVSPGGIRMPPTPMPPSGRMPPTPVGGIPPISRPPARGGLYEASSGPSAVPTGGIVSSGSSRFGMSAPPPSGDHWQTPAPSSQFGGHPTSPPIPTPQPPPQAPPSSPYAFPSSQPSSPFSFSPLSPQGPQHDAYGVHDVTLGGAVNHNANGDAVNFAGQVLKDIPGTQEYMQAHGQGQYASAPPVAAPPGGGGGWGGGGSGGGTTTNTTQTDPNLAKFQQAWEDRLKQLQQTETAPNLADTQREIDRSTSGIADNALGRKNALELQMARQGTGGGGTATALSNQIDSETQREQAGTAAGISMQRLHDQEARNEARRAQLNQFLSGGLPGAMAQGQLGLAQQGLGLQQLNSDRNYNLDWQRVQNEQQNQGLGQMLAFMNMYGGGRS